MKLPTTQAAARCVLLCVALAPCGCRSEQSPQTPQPAHDAAPAPPRDEPVVAPKPPASAPRIRPASVEPGTSCTTAGCHDSYAAASYVHAPVAGQSCDVCHGGEQPGHKFPLKRAGNDTCTYCHVVFTGKGHQHLPVSSGKCTVCHDPHAASHKFLFRETIATRCATCHPLATGQFIHEPYGVGACSVCHTPHEADNPQLTIASGAENCYRCHAAMKTRLAAATSRHPPVDASCRECHEPHASSHPMMLRVDRMELCLSCHEPIAATVRTATEQHGALFVQHGCENCHDAHGSGEPALLKTRVDEVCAQCHAQPQKGYDGREIKAVSAQVQRSRFLHGPVREGQCQECHQVHGSSNARLLAQAFPATFYQKFDVTNYALCFSCHEKATVMEAETTTLTGFRNGDRNLHFIHVNAEKGRSCRACHEMHASDQPKHMAEATPFEGGGWAVPVGFRKTATGGSCAPGCHMPYTYDRENPVAYGTTGEVQR